MVGKEKFLTYFKNSLFTISDPLDRIVDEAKATFLRLFILKQLARLWNLILSQRRSPMNQRPSQHTCVDDKSVETCIKCSKSMTDAEIFLQAVQFLEGYQKQRVSTDRRSAFISRNENAVSDSAKEPVASFCRGMLHPQGCKTMFRGARRTRRGKKTVYEEKNQRCSLFRSSIRAPPRVE